MNSATTHMPGITLRRAIPGDAPDIAAVFDAAVRTGWSYLGELVAEPMFTSDDWEQLVADQLHPNVLLVAVDDTDRVLGYTVVHPEDGEMFLLFVDPAYAGRGIGLLSSPLLTTRCALQVVRRRSIRARAKRAGTRRPHGCRISARRFRPRLGVPQHTPTRAASGQTALDERRSGTTGRRGVVSAAS